MLSEGLKQWLRHCYTFHCIIALQHFSEINHVFIFQSAPNIAIWSLKHLYNFLWILWMAETQVSVSLHSLLCFQRADGAYCPNWVCRCIRGLNSLVVHLQWILEAVFFFLLCSSVKSHRWFKNTFQMVLKMVTWYYPVLCYVSQTVAGAYTDVTSEALFSPRQHVPNCVHDKIPPSLLAILRLAVLCLYWGSC